MKPEKIFELEKKFYFNCFRRKKIVFEKGRGSYLFDLAGKKYLDFAGGLGSCSLGYSNPRVVNAICKQAKNLLTTTNLFYTEPQIVLAERLAKLAGMEKVFFSNSGTEAVEAAFKLARKCTGKYEIISTANAFHGRTFGALSATWNENYKKYCEPLVPGFKYVPFNDVNALQEAITPETAAFVVEPIQGEGGVNVPSDSYLKEVAAVCKEKDILLIVDEIQTGGGRTGKFFCYEHSGIKPDIVTAGKGLGNGVPIGVTLARQGLDFQPGEHGGTFGGNLLVCSAALAVLDEIKAKKIPQQAEKKGKLFRQRLEKMKNELSFVTSVRGKGLMLAMEFGREYANEIAEKCLAKRLIVNDLSKKVIRFLPQLEISEKEIISGLKTYEEVLQQCR